MVHITSLPPEILYSVFNHIDSVAQLAVCRLVCRGWNYPAEQCMFGKQIIIRRISQAIQLHNHLCRNESNGSLIKKLHWNIRLKELPLICEKLMAIAFTPTMERLGGTIQTVKFFDILTSIADANSWEFKNLKEIPYCYVGDEGGYLRALTLKRLKASTLSIATQLWHTGSLNWKMINLLDNFNTLRFLTLSGYIEGLLDIDLILKKCHFLETLTFVEFNAGGEEEDKEEVQFWVIQNKVIKVPSLKTIELIKSVCDPSFVEYLIYKYPNVTRFKSARHIIFDSFEGYHRILNAIKRIPSKELELILPLGVSMQKADKFAASRNEKIQFERRDYEIVMKVN